MGARSLANGACAPAVRQNGPVTTSSARAPGAGGRPAGVPAGLADRCEVQVAYAIGAAQPVGLYIETFGTETVPVDSIQRAVTSVFDLRPLAIVEELDLLRPIYAPTAAYGHFGRTSAAGYDNAFPWEQTTKVEALQAAVRG